MLVDKRREEALKSLYYPKEIAEKRDRCYGKVIDNYAYKYLYCCYTFR
jgi:hypothetical protein